MIVRSRLRRPSTAAIAKLGGLSVASVGEAMEGRNIMTGMRPVLPGGVAVGPATTCASPGGQNLALHLALHIAEPGDVIVAAAYPGETTTLWGGLASASARARHVVGAVVDGAVRDIAVIRSLDFPTWATAVSPRGGRKDLVGSVNDTVTCAGVLVHPGDVIVADDDGVAVIPYDLLDTVIEAATRHREREEALVEKLAAGASTLEVLGLADELLAAGVEWEVSRERP